MNRFGVAIYLPYTTSSCSKERYVVVHDLEKIVHSCA